MPTPNQNASRYTIKTVRDPNIDPALFDLGRFEHGNGGRVEVSNGSLIQHGDRGQIEVSDGSQVEVSNGGHLDTGKEVQMEHGNGGHVGPSQHEQLEPHTQQQPLTFYEIPRPAWDICTVKRKEAIRQDKNMPISKGTADILKKFGWQIIHVLRDEDEDASELLHDVYRGIDAYLEAVQGIQSKINARTFPTQADLMLTISSNWENILLGTTLQQQHNASIYNVFLNCFPREVKVYIT
ncbi:hypothetical protein NX059_003276 [Plenodomus lindquistii]|nr:hypothetical protein NX059_003276 [Plenodomus lindquistii]